ncbi:hypothetical protein N8569_00065 [bacterium]|nr:hypothetical protein [bacterium]
MPGDEVCLNCKILIQNKKKSSLFSKIDQNDSLLPLIIRLDKYNPKNSILKQEFPKLTKYTTSIEVESNKRERWLFYWAANRSKDPSHIMSERDAYGSNTNHGIVKTDENGNAKLVLNCPQPYKDDNSKLTYPRHVHYTFLKEDDTWNENINSLVVLCHLDFLTMKMYNDTKSHMIISTIVEDETIDNNVYLDYKSLYEMNRTERKHYLLRFLKDNIEKYPKLNSKVLSKNLKLRDIPIVVYDKNREDKSSLKTCEYLIDSNIVNVIEYSGGIDDFKTNMEKPKNDSDTDSEEEDDMKKIIYEGKTYYIHEGKDVTDDEYEIVGEWLQEEKRIKFFDKDNNKDKPKGEVDKPKGEVDKPKGEVDKPKGEIDNPKGEVDKPKGNVENKSNDEPNLDLKDRYKDKVVVKKLDGKIESENTDDDSDLDLNLEENDDIEDNKDDKILDDIVLSDEDVDINKVGGNYNYDSDNDSSDDDSVNDISNNLDGGKIKKVVKQIKNINQKQDIKIKTEKISVLNGKYNCRGITFF